MQNNNLPLIILAGGIGLALVFAFSGAKAQSSGSGSTSNPDPVNHPNAVLINGVWRDNTHFFDPRSITWKLIGNDSAITAGVTAKFNTITPQINGTSANYLATQYRLTEGAEHLTVGNKVGINHPDYQGKTGYIIKKWYDDFQQANYIAVSTMWNYLSSPANVIYISGIPLNKVSGQITKL